MLLEGGKGDAKKKENKKSDEANVLYVCVCVWMDRWVDGQISMTYEAKEKSAQ